MSVVNTLMLKKNTRILLIITQRERESVPAREIAVLASLLEPNANHLLILFISYLQLLLIQPYI